MIHAVTIEALTPDQVRQLDALVGQVMQHGFGTVTIVIERGRCVLVQPAPSIGMVQAPRGEGEST
jgi:hypothetical protein